MKEDRMLKYNEFVNSFIITESRVWAHPDRTYVVSPNYYSKVPNDLISHEYITSEDIVADNIYYIATTCKKINKKEALDFLKQKNFTLIVSEDSSINIVVGPKTSILTGKKSGYETTTNVKEGLIIYFFYSNIDKPTSLNIGNIIKQLKEVKLQDGLVDTKTKNEIDRWLDSTPLNKSTLNNLTDYWSVSQELLNNFNPKNVLLTRTGIFDDIRSLGQQLTGLAADKWNPGDLYVIDKKYLTDIESKIKQITKDKPADELQVLNNLFSHEMTHGNDLIGSIVSISIKQEKAQGGKAKQYFKKLTSDESTYNVTQQEQSLTEEELIDKIEKLRDFISKEVKKSTITINLEQDRGYKADKINLISKYSSLKLSSILLSDGPKIGEVLLGAVSFSASITGANPTFFKIIGSSLSKATTTKFLAGQTLGLLVGGVNSKDSEIQIIDRNTNKQIIFRFDISKGEENYHVQLNARPNGNVQSTLEIERITKF